MMAFILKYLFQIFLYREILFLIFGWAAYSYLAQYFIKKSEINLKTLKSFDFIHHIIDLLFMTVIFYYIGGVLWIGVVFYVLILFYASFLSSPKEGIIITSITFISYSLIVLLEYLDFSMATVAKIKLRMPE